MSEQQRVFLAISLCVLIFASFQVFYPPPLPVTSPTQTPWDTEPLTPNDNPQSPKTAFQSQGTPRLQDATHSTKTPLGHDSNEAAGGSADDALTVNQRPIVPEKQASIESGHLRATLNNASVALTKLELTDYRERLGDEQLPANTVQPMSLVYGTQADKPYQAGVVWSLGGKKAPPMTLDTTSSGDLQLVGKRQDGLATYVLVTQGASDYSLSYTLRVHNDSNAPTQAGAIFRLVMARVESTGGGMGMPATAAMGVCEQGQDIERKEFDDLEDESFVGQSSTSWVALDQQYFVVAAIPGQAKQSRCEMRVEGEHFLVDLVMEPQTLAVGERWEKQVTLYAGPKRDAIMAKAASSLPRIVDYTIMGIPLGFLARPMIWMLNVFHSKVGSWGISIMLLTLFVKLLLFPITYKSAVSMRQMQLLKPELDKIKERFGDDREKQ